MVSRYPEYPKNYIDIMYITKYGEKYIGFVPVTVENFGNYIVVLLDKVFSKT